MGRGNRVNRFAQRKRELKEKANNSNNPGEKHDDGRKPYVEIIRENADFEGYYKEQGICPPEEWSTFMATFKKDLPSSFRITSYPWGEAQVLKNLIKSKYFSELISCKQEDGEDMKPTNLPWYPHELAWQLQLTRSDIRRSEPLYRLHNFLVAETATGGVSRQETVSMIPPLVLDVRSDSRVLDMCASPGSKTVQLLEFLHSNENETPTGFVIANDVDNNRCYMLIHQTKRLNSPCLAITNADASLMPTMYIPDKENGGATKPLTFDRILCDVPCSGDGTLRKNPDIWMKWNPVHANHLHGVQYRILRRGCELLSIGGRLVYSTCSLNPVEDEAVIYRLLKETGDTMTLVDIGEKLPGLKYQEGLSHWKPASKDMVFYDKPEDIPQKWSTIVRASMFPPPPEEADKYKLNKCIRILPHYQNTGGFFVAALEKVDTLPWQKDQPYPTTNPSVNSESNLDNQPSEDVRESKKEPPRKRRKMDGYREDPFVFFTEKDNNEVFTSIREYYDIKSDFDTSCLLTRCHIGKKNNVYMVTPTVRDFVRLNENKIKIINIGVKTFVRSDSRHMTCPFRLSQEGLQWMLPYIGPKRRVTIPREDLIRMLVSIDDTNPPLITAFSKQTQQQITDKDKFATGSCVLEYSEESSPLRILRIGWRGAMSFRAYANKTDTVHYLRLLGEDVSKYEINKFKKEDSTNPETATEDNVENSTTDGADKNGEENGVEETDAKI